MSEEDDDFRGVPELCLICRKPVPEYTPEYCCSGIDCGCHGEATHPCVCSDACESAFFKNIGTSYDDRRKLAGIDVWKEETR
jgi:hypothetical protein